MREPSITRRLTLALVGALAGFWLLAAGLGVLVMQDEFAEIFEGLDESLGAASAQLITDAIAELRALPTTPGAQFRYSPVIARAWK